MSAPDTERVPPAGPAARGPSRATRAVAGVLIAGAAAIGALRLPGELAEQSDAAAAARALPVVDGVTQLPSVGPERTAFLAFARRTVPAGEPVRIVQPAVPPSRLETRTGGVPGVCGYAASGLTYYWLVYALRPRPSTCDPAARWTVYYGVEPPPGGTVHRYADGYAVVRR